VFSAVEACEVRSVHGLRTPRALAELAPRQRRQLARPARRTADARRAGL